MLCSYSIENGKLYKSDYKDTCRGLKANEYYLLQTFKMGLEGFDKYCMFLFGIQPWEVTIKDNLSPSLEACQKALAIGLTILAVLFFVPPFIWIGYLCFDSDMRKYIEKGSTNKMELYVVIIALTVNWMIAPIVQFFMTNVCGLGKKSVQFFEATQAMQAAQATQATQATQPTQASKCCGCQWKPTLKIFAPLVETIAMLMCLIWFMILPSKEPETYGWTYLVCGWLSIGRALLAYFYLRYILLLENDLSKIWFPWFKSLQSKMEEIESGNQSSGHEDDLQRFKEIMDECYNLIQVCIKGTDLFSKQFYWWIIVQLLNVTVAFTQLANLFFQMFNENLDLSGVNCGYAVGKGSIASLVLITSIAIIYWIIHSSRKVTDDCQKLKESLMDTYLSKDETATNWKALECKVSRITKKMDKFQGLVNVPASELLTWVMMFFLFFVPYLLKDDGTLICSPPKETGSTDWTCKPKSNQARFFWWQ